MDVVQGTFFFSRLRCTLYFLAHAHVRLLYSLVYVASSLVALAAFFVPFAFLVEPAVVAVDASDEHANIKCWEMEIIRMTLSLVRDVVEMSLILT
jgi:hypothetical protein